MPLDAVGLLRQKAMRGKIGQAQARLVVKGYKQQQGRDYDETFAPVARMETVRTVLSIATQHKWKIYQMDVKSAFLNGDLKEENNKAAVTPTVVGLKLTKEDSSKDIDPKSYKSIVGSLMYLTATRPDIMHAVSLISRFMERPKETHWQEAKRILRYVNGTKGFGILYSSSESFMLIGYTDSDWAGSVDDRKSTSGYVFHMGS
eukprot:PITA_02333